MIERMIDNADEWPSISWKITVEAVCKQCGNAMTMDDPASASPKLVCKCGHSQPLEKSPDDVADDLMARAKTTKKMDVDKIRELAEIETEIEKREAAGDER